MAQNNVAEKNLCFQKSNSRANAYLFTIFCVNLNHFFFLFEFQRTAFKLMKNVVFSLTEIQTTLDNVFPYRNQRNFTKFCSNTENLDLKIQHRRCNHSQTLIKHWAKCGPRNVYA